MSGRPVVVLLCGPGDATHAVHHALLDALAGEADVVAVMEEAPSRLSLARRRARRLGWPTVAGQVALVAIGLPLLRRRARARIDDVVAASGLDRRPAPVAHRVPSVNAPVVPGLLQELRPAVVVVHGTRIIGREVLGAVPAPFVNLHAGITPRYRGVHGGYWALAEGRPDLCGSTVHLVDPGIDTGGILGQATFAPSPDDSIASYPYLHLACGIPLLVEAVQRALAGRPLAERAPLAGAEPSVLRWHPTLWGYLARRLRHGVR